MNGIANWKIADAPIAIVDLETTGLLPGIDRVVEVSVVRFEPGGQKRLVLDTLVNPGRPMSATEIHGITDDDVREAPRFEDIAGDVIAALSEAVLAAYNVYFDIRFLGYELGQLQVRESPPHFCLMYLRPMLGLGPRCKLEEACQASDISYRSTHVAAHDAIACGELFERYLEVLGERGIRTFSELAKLKRYKFTKSFENTPFLAPGTWNLSPSGRRLSRSDSITYDQMSDVRRALCSYWDTLTAVVADLEITDEELRIVQSERGRLKLKEEQVRVLHARVFAEAVSQYVADEWLDDNERRKLRELHSCLSTLGWAPGE